VILVRNNVDTAIDRVVAVCRNILCVLLFTNKIYAFDKGYLLVEIYKILEKDRVAEY